MVQSELQRISELAKNLKRKSDEVPAKVVEKFIEKQVEDPATHELVKLAESPSTVVPELDSSNEVKSPVKSKLGIKSGQFLIPTGQRTIFEENL